ncbi:MAG: redoxin domain-containing protein [Methylococcaceae bacterium]|nr:redoxin domain-containing protein [Methylococcaceae bacterium]
MNQIAKIGIQAPQLQLSKWVQGTPTNLDQLLGSVVLITVFQVNCPGCFLYSLPQAIDLHQRYFSKGLTVIGMATAFEDFDKNTLDNLKSLVKQNKVIGETLRVLEENKQLTEGRLPYLIPFPMVMDRITKRQKAITDNEIATFIKQHISDYIDHNVQQKKHIQQQVLNYLQSRLYIAETFTSYALQGTPSYIVIDKKGVLKACEFGRFTDLEWLINILIHE